MMVYEHTFVWLFNNYLEKNDIQLPYFCVFYKHKTKYHLPDVQ